MHSNNYKIILFCFLSCFSAGFLAAQNTNSTTYAVLFSAPNFQGEQFRIYPGNEIQQLTPGNADEQIGSFQVHGDIAIELWNLPNFQGRSIRISENIANTNMLRNSGSGGLTNIGSLKVQFGKAQPFLRNTVRSGNTPAVRQPERGEIRLYGGGNFEGDFLVYNGPISVANANRIDRSTQRWNDRISSLYIKGPLAIILYQKGDFGGRGLRVDESVGDFRDLRARDPERRNWNDEVSSFKIIEVGATATAPMMSSKVAGTLYEHQQLNGNSLTLVEGQEIDNLNDFGWNDMVSSLTVTRGYKIQLFEGGGFRGESIIVKSNMRDLGRSPGRWNDRVSSLRVLKDL